MVVIHKFSHHILLNNLPLMLMLSIAFIKIKINFVAVIASVVKPFGEILSALV